MSHLFTKSLGLTLVASLLSLPLAVNAATFVPPANNAAPRHSTGGASRGSFIPPANNATPQQSTGGASRGSFIPPANNATPQQSTGGASRGSFVPPANNATPQQSTGGASRHSFAPPSDNATLRSYAGGASRTNLYGYLPAEAGAQPLSMLAITPENFYGTTLLERPTFLVYVPQSDATEAIFSLKDEAGNIVYQTVVAVPGQSGIVAVQVPTDAPGLELGKPYQWLFALLVEGNLSPSTPYVDAWVSRIEPDLALAEQLQQGTAHQNAETLAANGVWYDSVALLTDLQMTGMGQGNSVTTLEQRQDWQELLNSVGLETVVAAYSESPAQESPLR
jgi:hypothetical protein